MSTRIVPFVDHEIGYLLLEKLISYHKMKHLKIPAVITTSENETSWWPSVKKLCIEANIPLHIYRSPFPQKELDLEVDWFLLLSWKYILPPELISLPAQGTLNLHYSLLPEFRGVYPVNWAIIEGKTITGITYHFVNEKIDDGNIFMQIEAPILLKDTARTLQSKLDKVALGHFDQFIERLLNFGEEVPCTDINSSKIQNYYSRKKFNDACALNLDGQHGGMDLFNLLRGLTFLPDSKNAYIIDENTGKKLYISLEIREEQ